METRPFTAAVAQLTSKADLEDNLAATRDLAAQAAAAGASLLALPENFAFLGERERDKYPHAEVLAGGTPGPILGTVIAIAKEHGLWVSAGGLAERLDQERDVPAESITSAYNTHIVVSPSGELVARYRKIHLFDLDIPGRVQLRESDNTTAGESTVSVATPLGTWGLSICYDLRFPELYRTLAMTEGAQILLIPAAFTAHTGAAHWHTLLRARAIENQCYVLAAAQAGRHNAKRESFGHSLIIDPWGDILDECSEGPGLAIAELDLNRVAEIRQNMPCHQHQRLSFDSSTR